MTAESNEPSQSASIGSRDWREVSWVAFDTETSGRYPVESEICEIAAVKWTKDGEQATFASLVKPTRPMSDDVIRIHGITNEMVADAPSIAEVLPKFIEFIHGSVILAHHAQFDLGFVAAALEGAGLPLPPEPTVCTSLLAQATISETPNHRLQTLVPFFGLDPGQAHRALDDARSCLNVAIRIFERLQAEDDKGSAAQMHLGESAAAANPTLTVDRIAMKMLRRSKTDLGLMYFKRFSLNDLRQNPNLARFMEAARRGENVELKYAGGSRPGQARIIRPIGVIRQLDGDALVAIEAGEGVPKRYWIKDVQAIV